MFINTNEMKKCGLSSNSPDNPAVSICVTTFNHAAYVREAMESFLSQIASFEYEILVHDDASTDGTAEILKEYASKYPDVVRLFLEDENQWGKDTYKGGYNRGLLVPNSRGKYVAFCEGDDCWIDPHKLQKQVDYLEEHPDVVWSCHAAKVVDGRTGEELGIMGMGTSEHDLKQEEIILNWNVPTASWMYRNGLLAGLADEWAFDMPAGDFPSVLYGSLQGTVHYVPEVMSLYRYQTPGSYTSRTASEKSKLRNCYRWIDMYSAIDEATGNRWSEEFLLASKTYLRNVLVLDGQTHLTDFAKAALKSLGVADRLKIYVRHGLRALGFDIVPVGFGENARHRLVRIEK